MPKKFSDYSIEEVLKEDPKVLAILLEHEYSFSAPETIESIEQLKKAGAMLGKLSNIYSYLIQLISIAKIDVRQKKRQKVEKDIIDDAIDRKDVITNAAEAAKMKYNAISRMLTVKQQVNEELKMTDGR